MNKLLFVFITLAILRQTTVAQISFEVTSFQPTPENFRLLLLSNETISKNDTINEKIVSLVDPTLLDSTIEHKKQHHKLGPLGWFIHAFGGYNWRAVSMHKQKFVGTVVRNSRSGSEEYTEYDINFDLNFHLPEYLQRVFIAYDLQRKYHKQDIRPSHRTNYNIPPFVRKADSIDIKQYRLHCELTPARSFRAPLNYSFYPTLPESGGLKQHPNFNNDKPTVGFYGTFCLDCNHNCHPELHPYEWMWWLKNNDTDSSVEKIWNVGLFHESSNRMKKWSVNPMTGTITVPFTFVIDSHYGQHPTIEIEHLVFNRFMDKEMGKLNLPVNVINSGKAFQPVAITKSDSVIAQIDIRFMRTISTQGLQYWLSNLNFDEQHNLLTGMFNMAVSVIDLYTAQIKFRNVYGSR